MVDGGPTLNGVVTIAQMLTDDLEKQVLGHEFEMSSLEVCMYHPLRSCEIFLIKASRTGGQPLSRQISILGLISGVRALIKLYLSRMKKIKASSWLTHSRMRMKSRISFLPRY